MSTSSSSAQSPFRQGFRQPAEWQPQQAVWLAWPHDAELWAEQLIGAQDALLQLIQVIQSGGAKVNVLVPDEDREQTVRQIAQQKNLTVQTYQIPVWDIWLRDTGPIFIQNKRGELATVTFQFNGWGEKYVFPQDQKVAGEIVRRTGLNTFSSSMVAEGGAIDVDGEGTGLVTEECLLNRNRNPGIERKTVAHTLQDFLGIEHLIWIKRGLRNDHTDGHIDNLVRFAAPGLVLCMEPLLKDDPNKDILQEIIKQVKKSKNAKGQKLEMLTMPSPGRVENTQGDIMPASYLNFLITNNQVAVPIFNVSTDEPVLYRFERAFPDKKIIGIPCRDLLEGGGTLHCISQQQPQGSRNG